MPDVVTAAQNAATSASSGSVLTALLLAGLMGLLGQGVRSVVGLKTMVDSAAANAVDASDLFRAARLVVSLIIGFLAGVGAAFAIGLDKLIHIETGDIQLLLGIAASGYAGTDFIEGFISKYLPGNAPAPADTGPAGGRASLATANQVADLSESISDIHAMISAVSDKVGDDSSPIGRFKQKAPLVMDQLISDFQLEVFQAAGILGNIGVECNGFTQMQEVHPVGGGLGGYGWAQWTGPRRRQYLAWCAQNNLDKDSDAANYGFMKQEFSTSYKSVITNLKKTKSIDDAVTVVLVQYEGAGVPAKSRRITWANIALTAYQQTEAQA